MVCQRQIEESHGSTKYAVQSWISCICSNALCSLYGTCWPFRQSRSTTEHVLNSGVAVGGKQKWKLGSGCTKGAVIENANKLPKQVRQGMEEAKQEGQIANKMTNKAAKL